jgi:hypothetical protein
VARDLCGFTSLCTTLLSYHLSCSQPGLSCYASTSWYRAIGAYIQVISSLGDFLIEPRTPCGARSQSYSQLCLLALEPRSILDNVVEDSAANPGVRRMKARTSLFFLSAGSNSIAQHLCKSRVWHERAMVLGTTRAGRQKSVRRVVCVLLLMNL